MKLKTVLKWIGIAVALFLLIQLIPDTRPVVTLHNPNDFLLTEKVPVDVAEMFRNSCYDCHSNQTVYPWYAHVAPVKWLVIRDIRVARKKLNFSNWAQMKTTKKMKALDDIAHEVKGGDMPFFLYPIIHKKARLSQADRVRIVDWVRQYSKELLKTK